MALAATGPCAGEGFSKIIAVFLYLLNTVHYVCTVFNLLIRI